MTQVSNGIRKFFEEYEKRNSIFDLEGIAALYGDSFLFADPNGVKPPLTKKDFLKMLPKRRGFFETIGLKSRKIISLEETILDVHYIMVKTQWRMRFEKEGIKPLDDTISTTYILYLHSNTLQIVFQIDHQDLMKRVGELGLLSA